MDKPIFSKRVSAGTRAYYIDAHTDAKGQPYITLSELTIKEPRKGKGNNKPKRQTIFIHMANMDHVLSALNEVINHIKERECEN